MICIIDETPYDSSSLFLGEFCDKWSEFSDGALKEKEKKEGLPCVQ